MDRSMAILIKLAKTAIVAVLLNDTVKSALASKLVRLVNGLAQPITGQQSASRSFAGSTGGHNRPRYLETFVELALALSLMRAKKGRWNMQPLVISAIGALLATMLRPMGGQGATQGSGQGAAQGTRAEKGRVIDIDEYTVVDER
jgi:hypothetical protein